MKAQTTIALTAAALIGAVTAASAATMANPGETLHLSAKQRQTAWNDLNSQASNQDETGIHSAIGAVLPGTVKLEAMPSKAASDVPALRPYDFAVVQHRLLIVNPSNKVIAYVVKG